MKKQNGDPAAQPGDRLLRMKQIIPHKLPIARTTFRKWVSEGRLPQPIRLGDKIMVWREIELDTAITAMMNTQHLEGRAEKEGIVL